jgi:hypothetical protein
LNKHQRTSKYCVKIQLKADPNKVIENYIYECEFCKRHLSAKCALKKHLLICKVKNENEKDKDEKYECEFCKRHLSVKCALKKHLLICKVKNKKDEEIDMKNEVLNIKKEIQKLKDSRIKENNEKEDANACILLSFVYRGIRPVIKNIYHKEFKRLRAELAKYQRIDIDSSIANMHLELRELEESYKKMDIINESGDYISQLSKCLPSSILDRIYHDNLINQSIALDPQYDSDEEFKQQLEKEVRMIGDHCVVELQKYKD